jgi:hypothetical protein
MSFVAGKYATCSEVFILRTEVVTAMSLRSIVSRDVTSSSLVEVYKHSEKCVGAIRRFHYDGAARRKHPVRMYAGVKAKRKIVPVTGRGGP